MTWRTIESAPRDGTRVDLWCQRNWNPPEAFERRCDWFFDRTHHQWRSHKNLHFVDALENHNLTATHWQPLPPPPDAPAVTVNPMSRAEETLRKTIAAYPRDLSGFSGDRLARLRLTVLVDDLNTILGDLESYRRTLATIGAGAPAVTEILAWATAIDTDGTPAQVGPPSDDLRRLCWQVLAALQPPAREPG